MALYAVERTDEVQPGEFVSAYVLAPGRAMARKVVSHLPGVTKKNVKATKVDTAGLVRLLAIYEDERAG